MQPNKTCTLTEQYLGYLSIIKNRSENTILGYRTDLLMFFSYIMYSRNINIIDISYNSCTLY
ncbi:MAG: integrase family protein [Herbinix sp.]|jgi:site-specific recombinase XerD|nr:integrase family protein [Herbinix sp.]